MHELALARSIFRVADRAAAGHAISMIYLDVGVLRRVVSGVLDFAWGCMGCQSENLTRSKLRINPVSVVITYEECEADTPIDDNLIFVRTICSSARYRVKTGEESVLTEMDVP